MGEKKQPADEPEVVNPRYAGATFGDIARALARPVREDEDAVPRETDETVPAS